MKRGKKAQMKLSFGMIFSIILIVFFLAFGFFAIKMFIGTSDKAQLSKFIDSFQTDVTNLWKAPQGSQQIDYDLPNEIQEVCIADNTEENLIFLPEESEKLPPVIIEHLNVPWITAVANDPESRLLEDRLGNQFRASCFSNERGKLTLKIEKNFGEDLVRVVR